jgi:hypothetical protein
MFVYLLLNLVEHIFQLWPQVIGEAPVVEWRIMSGQQVSNIPLAHEREHPIHFYSTNLNDVIVIW